MDPSSLGEVSVYRGVCWRSNAGSERVWVWMWVWTRPRLVVVSLIVSQKNHNHLRRKSLVCGGIDREPTTFSYSARISADNRPQTIQALLHIHNILPYWFPQTPPPPTPSKQGLQDEEPSRLHERFLEMLHTKVPDVLVGNGKAIISHHGWYSWCKFPGSGRLLVPSKVP